MPRVSAFKGTWEENRRPYITMAPDAYVAIQGQTTVVTCGECMKEVNLNKYITGISTEASVDSPPGSATVNLSIPDTDVNEFFVEGNFVIIPMMELEIYAKGYYTVGGIPQYYRIFLGMVINISKSWSNGVTTYTLSCKDILHWWEKTNVILNPAFVGPEGASTNYTLFQNQFAGLNPYTIIVSLARESMGDFSITDGSYTSFKPEVGPEEAVVGNYAKDVMAYWQMKFGNIWNSLVLYGTSGIAYTFEGDGDISPLRISHSIFKNEVDILNENKETAEFKVQPHEITAFKKELDRAGDVQFFQNDTQSKLSVALQARDQIQYEFYCDTTGDIVFKPPFYNLNVIPNKPVSWIQDFEIIDDNINDSEQEVVTHMTSSGNAFGGVMDYGLNTDITVPRTGVVDWHLLKRYGWRRMDFQCEWAGNPRKLFWFLVDMIDRVNAKRHNGTITIPMRPEIRMGFPVWIPYYDSFFYVNGVSHNFSPGGQATTTLTLVAKRSKFIAPSNMGKIERVSSQKKKEEKNNATKVWNINTYKISFDGGIGQTAGLGSENIQGEPSNTPLIIRDPNTGKILGYPNVVMVYRTTYDDKSLAKTTSEKGSAAGRKGGKPVERPMKFKYDKVVRETFKQLNDNRRAGILQRIRYHRYEAGMTNSGLYDYAVDTSGDFKEMVLIPVTSVVWGDKSSDPADKSGALSGNPSIPKANGKSKASAPDAATDPPPADSQVNNGFDGYPNAESYMANRNSELDKRIAELRKSLDFVNPGRRRSGSGYDSNNGLKPQVIAKKRELGKAQQDLNQTIVKNHKGKTQATLEPDKYTADEKQKASLVDSIRAEIDALEKQIAEIEKEIYTLRASKDGFKILNNLNVSVRPVSDEFGFEVIGHHRYGRGVFIDRGQLRLKFAASENSPGANSIQIQFSPSGGMITTNPPTDLKNASQPLAAETFETMQPEDWITGASNNGSFTTLTNVNTYSSAINHAISANSNIGAVFIEADATRRAKTFWELQPTMANGLDEVGFPNCSCTIGRFQWFSIFPRNVLDEILSPSRSTTYKTNANPYTLQGFVYKDAFTGEDTNAIESVRMRPISSDSESTIEDIKKNEKFAIYSKKDGDGNVIDSFREKVGENSYPPAQYDVKPSSAGKASERAKDYDVGLENTVKMSGNDDPTIGVTSFPDFFKRLNEYLTNKFMDDLNSNEDREALNSGSDLNAEYEEYDPAFNSTDYIDPNSVLGASGGSLFDRVSLGDPQALQTLQDQINWDWSNTEAAYDDFAKTADEQNKRLAQVEDDFKQWKRNLSQQGFTRSLASSVAQHGVGISTSGTGFFGGGETFTNQPEPIGSTTNETSGKPPPGQPQPITPAPFTTPPVVITDPFEFAGPTNPVYETVHDSGEVPPSPRSPKTNP